MADGGAVLKPAGNSKTNPRENKQGKVCYADVFKLTDLPGIMDKKGWKVSSILMRKWLNNPAYTISVDEKEGNTDARQYPKHLVDASTVTMAWALSFPRINKEYQSIFAAKGIFKETAPMYENERAKRQLVKRLLKAGKFTKFPEQFGNLNDSVLNVNEQWQFQRHRVDDDSTYVKAWLNDTVTSDPELDDLWGGLGRFLFKIAGEGTVTPTTKVIDTRVDSIAVDTGARCVTEVQYYEVSVEKLGVYVRDTYDFNGEQYLGHWSKTSSPYARVYPLTHIAGGRGGQGECPDDFLPVNNERFVAHRSLTGKGGDLLVYSDVLITTLKHPFKFKVTRRDLADIIGTMK
jgi:hypothetical protein